MSGKVRRFKRYPKYKDLGMEWLGEIPAHWKALKLKYLLRQPLAYGANEAAELTDPDLPRYIRITDVRDDGSLRDDTFRSLPEEVAAPHLLQDGDLLFARSGATAGKTFRFDRTWGKAAHAGYLIRARLNEGLVHSRFLQYFTQSEMYWDWLRTNFIQATIQNVSAERFSGLHVSFPSPIDQSLVVRFLDREMVRIDALAAKNARLIELLAEQRSALITHAVTQGLDSRVARKSSGIEWLGDMPTHWRVTKMWDATDAVSGGTPSKENPTYWDGDIPWVSPKDMKRRFIDSSADTISALGMTKSALKLVPNPAVLIVVRGMILAHSFPVGVTRVPVTINQDMKALLLREDLEPEFFAYWLDGIGRNLLSLLVDEAAHGTKAIRMDKWRAISVQIPPRQEQRDIVSFLDKQLTQIDGLMARVTQAVHRLQELRTALISAAVTGKIDVREEVA